MWALHNWCVLYDQSLSFGSPPFCLYKFVILVIYHRTWYLWCLFTTCMLKVLKDYNYQKLTKIQERNCNCDCDYRRMDCRSTGTSPSCWISATGRTCSNICMSMWQRHLSSHTTRIVIIFMAQIRHLCPLLVMLLDRFSPPCLSMLHLFLTCPW